MGQWFLQWGWTLAGLVASVVGAMVAFRYAQESVLKSGGDLKKAIIYVFGPFVAFGAIVAMMVLTFPLAVSSIYGAVNNSAVSQSFYQLGTAGVSALGGAFGATAITIPEAPNITDVLISSIPSESDLRNVLVGGNSGQQSAPAASESVPAAQSSTWTAPASAATTSNESVWTKPINTNQGWGNTPVLGPQPQNPVQGPKPQPTTAPLPTQGPAEKPANSGGWNVTFGGGGPLAADADAAIASATATTYTVKRGDYATKIGKQFGIAASVLCRVNRIADCNNLRVGMVLTIPGN